MKFEREEGFWLGGFVINFAAGESFLLVLFVLLIVDEANGTHVSAALFVAIGLALAVGGPALTFPFSRTTWSAIDQIMRPLSASEVAAAQARVARSALGQGSGPEDSS